MEITDAQIQKKNRHRISVYVDNEYSFSLDEVDYVRLGIKIGSRVSEKDIAAYNLESNLSKARAKALDVISRRDISESDLRKKLSDKGFDSMIIDIVVDELSLLGYIDDYEYALKYIADATTIKYQGKRKIKYDLSQKGISSEIIDRAFLEFDDDSKEHIAQIICIKYSSLDLNDFKNKQKISRYLASKGYEFSEIDEAIKYVKEDNIE